MTQQLEINSQEELEIDVNWSSKNPRVAETAHLYNAYHISRVG